MKDIISFEKGDRVRVINEANELVGKTGVVSFFLPGEQTKYIGRGIIKNLVVVKMDDTRELEQFSFEELVKT